MTPDDEFEDEKPDDRALFRQQMQDVEPLKGDNRVSQPRPRRPPRRQQHQDSAAGEERFADRYIDQAELAAVPEILSFARAGVQHSKLAKLRQGKLSMQDSIDLHGSTVADARSYLVAFLDECRDRGITVVRIVHGKGNRSKGNIPVIKGMLDRWLREAPEVLAFHSALPRDGGSGALYVLLKK